MVFAMLENHTHGEEQIIEWIDKRNIKTKISEVIKIISENAKRVPV